MGLKQQINPGVNFTPAYQASGTPWCTTLTDVTTTPVRINFPYVTRWVAISARDGNQGAVRVGFSEHGVEATVTANYFLLELAADDTGDDRYNGQTPRLELRCKSIWVRGDTTTIGRISIIAGLTGIMQGSFPILTGSEGFKGIG